MVKLWQKDYKLNEKIEKFTVGNDYLLDKVLIKYDIYASLAHAFMLNKIGILKDKEFKKLKGALIGIIRVKKVPFEIEPQDEDVHTALENYLTEKLGELGKKIHTARSRNDQVLVDLRLYSKEKLHEVRKLVLELALNLINSAEKNKEVPMPGYTHSRKAMPSSVGMYLCSFAESLMDGIKVLENAHNINNQCPLGSGAGYGLPLNVNRELTASILGFEKVQANSLYVQNSRGKIESMIIFSLSFVMDDLARLANDLVIFSMDEFGFFSLPDEFCTGSSIMPQKINPDVLELMRAKSAKVNSNLFLVKNIASKLQSGYSRDLQLTKEPLIESFDITLSSLEIFNLIFKNLQVNMEKCTGACTPELYATGQAYELVKRGISFRDAYKKIALEIGSLKMPDPVISIKSGKHTGSTGNLGLEKTREKLINKKKELELEIEEYNGKIRNLLI